MTTQDCAVLQSLNGASPMKGAEPVQLFETRDVTIIMLITPELALEWLTRNTHNRPVDQGAVKVYVRDILAGNWQINGESIKFSRTGVLLDGQHRLLAIAEAKRAVQSHVTFGLDDKTFATIDAGKRRSMADVLNIGQEINAFQLAAALNVIWRYEHGVLFKSVMNKGTAPTHPELNEVLNRHPGVRKSVSKGLSCTMFIGPGMGAGLHYLFACNDAALADSFFQSLATGENLSADEPVHLLRNRLINNRASQTKLGRVDVIRYTVKAWNATRQSRRLRVLKLSESDLTSMTIL